MSEKMNLAQAAQLLDVKESTVKRWAREKLLSPVNPGEENLIFEREAVLRYKEINDRFSGRA